MLVQAAQKRQELSQSFTNSSWMTLGTTSGRRFPKKLAPARLQNLPFICFNGRLYLQIGGPFFNWKRWTKYITKSGWSKQMFMVYLNDQRVPCCNRTLSHQPWKIHAIFIAWDSHFLRGTFVFIAMVPFFRRGQKGGKKKREWWLGWVENLSLFLFFCCTTSRLDEKKDLGHTGPCEVCHVTSRKNNTASTKRTGGGWTHHCYRITQKGAMFKKTEESSQSPVTVTSWMNQLKISKCSDGNSETFCHMCDRV